MLYDYRQESKTPMLLTLANGNTIEGEFIDLRIETDTLPKGKLWYHIRHTDDDWTEPASLKNGCVVVNFCGTFICDPINDLTGHIWNDDRLQANGSTEDFPLCCHFAIDRYAIRGNRHL